MRERLVADDRPPAIVTVHRFFVPPESVREDGVEFSAEQSRQMERVLRLRPGNRVLALDGKGAELEVVLARMGRRAFGKIASRTRNEAEPRMAIHLYQGVLKGTRIETVLQKGTEVGVARFIPLLADRSVSQAPTPSRRRRYQSIVREAAEQSRRGCIPEVAEPLPFAEAIRRATEAGAAIMLWEDEVTAHLVELELPEGTTEVGLFVGPEGGFTEAEVTHARAMGVRTATLGKRILRAETAGVVGPALLLARFGEMG